MGTRQKIYLNPLQAGSATIVDDRPSVLLKFLSIRLSQSHDAHMRLNGSDIVAGFHERPIDTNLSDDFPVEMEKVEFQERLRGTPLFAFEESIWR